jgi:threonine/homoserine/homoserine lactone efflux protein
VTPGVFLALTATVAVAALTPGPAVAAIVARAVRRLAGALMFVAAALVLTRV